MAEIQAIAMNRDQIKNAHSSRFILDIFIPFLFAKQIFINILGGERHIVGAVFEIIAALVIYVSIILVMMRESKRSTVFYIPLRVLYLWHALLIFYWSTLILLSPNAGTLIQRIMSSLYDGGFTLMIWVPVICLTSINDVKRVIRTLIIVTTITGLMGILQWFVPATNLPFFLQGDQTVSLSATLFGTVRVNGLIGTSLEFALLMAIMTVFFYIRLDSQFSFSSLIVFFIMLLGLSFAASRAFWLVTALVILIVTLFGKRNNKQKLLLLILMVGFTIVPAIRNYFWIPLTTRHPAYVASVDYKVSAIRSALNKLSSSPMIGTGLGFQTAPDFGNASHKIITDGFWWAVLLEGGIIGIILVFGLLGLVSWIFYTALRNNGGQNSAFVCQLAKWGIAIIGIAILGNFSNSSLNNQVLNITFYLMIGIVLASINIAFRERFAQRSKTGG